ncbi:MAG: TPR repeat SEL1 subfamily [Gallionellaceae bacterium]|nr:MAG: TPR repeat SEL1 subfamily [Gallionellaceae bacterium]
MATSPAHLKKSHTRIATKQALFITMLAAACFAGNAAAIPQDGNISCEKESCAALLKQLELLASNGDADAQFAVGAMYANGQGTPQDYPKAAAWYRKAAEQGHARAQYHIGAMHDIGQGVPQNYRLAAMWFRKAAETEAANARTPLSETPGKATAARAPAAPERKTAKVEAASKTVGVAATTGVAAEAARQKASPEVAHKNPAPAESSRVAPLALNGDDTATRYRNAAEKGIADAQFVLGAMYANGQGVERNYHEAVAWYRKAADQGYAKAQYNLGRMYISGQGVPYDYLQAVKWFNRAAAQDDMETHSQKEMLKRTASFR